MLGGRCHPDPLARRHDPHRAHARASTGHVHEQVISLWYCMCAPRGVPVFLLGENWQGGSCAPSPHVFQRGSAAVGGFTWVPTSDRASTSTKSIHCATRHTRSRNAAFHHRKQHSCCRHRHHPLDHCATGAQGFPQSPRAPFFLGIAVDQHSDGSISIHQRQNIVDMGKKYDMGHEEISTPRNIPCNTEMFAKLAAAKNPGDIASVDKTKYLQIVGSLLYVSTQTRPDIAYHMSVLCKYMAYPTPEAYSAARQVLTYLLSTKDLKITYRSGKIKYEGSEKYQRQSAKNYGFMAFSDASCDLSVLDA